MARRSGRQRKVASTPEEPRGRVRGPSRCWPVGERAAEVQVRGLGEVAIARAGGPTPGQVAARRRAEDASDSPAVDLARRLEEERRVREEPRDRDAGVREPLLAAHQVLRHERPIRPGQHVVVHACSTLPKAASHLPDLQQEAAGQRGEGDEALLDLDALGAEGEEEVGAGVGVHDGLERGLGLVHLERGGSPPSGPARRAQEVADHGDVGVEDLGAASLRTRGGAARDGRRASLPGGTSAAAPGGEVASVARGGRGSSVGA